MTEDFWKKVYDERTEDCKKLKERVLELEDALGFTDKQSQKLAKDLIHMIEQRDIAQAAVTAWQGVFEGIEAYIKDRMEAKDEADTETYLRIIKADVSRIIEQSQKIAAARWEDYRRQEEILRRMQITVSEFRTMFSRMGYTTHIQDGFVCAEKNTSKES